MPVPKVGDRHVGATVSVEVCDDHARGVLADWEDRVREERSRAEGLKVEGAANHEQGQASRWSVRQSHGQFSSGRSFRRSPLSEGGRAKFESERAMLA